MLVGSLTLRSPGKQLNPTRKSRRLQYTVISSGSMLRERYMKNSKGYDDDSGAVVNYSGL